MTGQEEPCDVPYKGSFTKCEYNPITGHHCVKAPKGHTSNGHVCTCGAVWL